MKLTKDELNFIKTACIVNDGVYDFENLSGEEFEARYDIHIDDAPAMVIKLLRKTQKQLSKLNQVTNEPPTNN